MSEPKWKVGARVSAFEQIGHVTHVHKGEQGGDGGYDHRYDVRFDDGSEAIRIHEIRVGDIGDGYHSGFYQLWITVWFYDAMDNTWWAMADEDGKNVFRPAPHPNVMPRSLIGGKPRLIAACLKRDITAEFIETKKSKG